MKSPRALLAGLASVVLAGTACAAQGAGAQHSDTIKLGALLSLSGPAAAYGVPERTALKAVAKNINDHGGVNGRKIQLVVIDDKSEPTECARAMTEFSQKEVVAVLGGTTGSCTLAAAPVAARSKIPMLAPNSTPAVTAEGTAYFSWVFRSAPNDLTNVKVLFNRAVQDGAKKVAVFYQEDAFGEQTEKYIRTLAAKQGTKVVVSQSAPLDATSVEAQVSKLSNSGADAIMLQVGSGGLIAAFMHAAQTVGLHTPLYGGIGFNNEGIVSTLGGSAENLISVSVGNYSDPGPSQAELGSLLKANGAQLSGFPDLLITNGLAAATEAIKKTRGDVTGKSVRTALENLCPFKAYSPGTGCYSARNHEGWGASSLVTAQLRKGSFVTLH